jgi:hypothetical protein
VSNSIFKLNGSWVVTPAQPGSPSGDPDIPALFDEKVELDRKHYDEYELIADAPVTVGFGGVTNANVVIIKVDGERITARLTSAAGSTQSIPVEEFLALISLSVPITAIDLTRATGVTTTVRVFLGQRIS